MSPPPPTGRRLAAFALTAKSVAFYSNKYAIGADGDVVVTLGDGTRITGNTFAMDLRLNRFVIAGDVMLIAAGRTLHGAAFAEYFDFDRAYFDPILSEPDRWTFAAGDYTHPLLGREMPGDTFFLPDLADERVFLYARHATIDPKQSVRFTPASINFGPNVFVAFPSYFLVFSPNPNFAQNALPGAYVDAPLDFAGGEHALATAHLRYDAVDKIFPAYEEHQVSNNSYVVGSISPLTRPFKQYNLLAFDRISPGIQVQISLQESAFQHGFTQPLAASGYAALQLTGSLSHSYLQLTLQNYYDSLLGQPKPGIDGLLYYGDPSHNWVPDHPLNAQLAWIGNRQPLGTLPFTTQVRSALGFANNTITPLQTLGGVNYTTIYSKSFGFNLATKTLVLRKDPSGRPDLYFTGSFDKQRQFFSVPHYIDIQGETTALTKVIVPGRLTALLSYNNQNTGDFYGDQQLLAYPPPASGATFINPFTGQAVLGYDAFRGFGTVRSLLQQVVWTPSTSFTLNVSMRENHDYPHPFAGPPMILGPSVAFENSGPTPYEADFDLRYRFRPTLVLDLARSYYFGFGGYERWSPEFYVQILK